MAEESTLTAPRVQDPESANVTEGRQYDRKSLTRFRNAFGNRLKFTIEPSFLHGGARVEVEFRPPRNLLAIEVFARPPRPAATRQLTSCHAGKQLLTYRVIAQPKMSFCQFSHAWPSHGMAPTNGPATGLRLPNLQKSRPGISKALSSYPHSAYTAQVGLHSSPR